MTVAAAIDWEDWAPPLSPPVDGGLSVAVAQSIADVMWADDPHCAAAEMWEAYAATLPPTAPVAQVTTGAQSVSYSPASPAGDYGAALARANWHRSFCTGQLTSASLHSAMPKVVRPLYDDDWWLGGWPGFWEVEAPR